MVRAFCFLAGLSGSLAVSGAAWAVDLVNADATPHAVVVVENGAPYRFTIAPRATLGGVCRACTVQVDNGKPVAAEDNDTVTIRGPKLTVSG